MARLADNMADALALARDQKLFSANAPMAKCGASQEWRGLQGGLAFAGFAPMAWIESCFGIPAPPSAFVIRVWYHSSGVILDQMFANLRKGAHFGIAACSAPLNLFPLQWGMIFGRDDNTSSGQALGMRLR
ncbi:MAG: hypothetical protein OXG78_02405 [Chloroflexi bacterium]|nr:hypothetical protein [Chloroflexota bacterium]